MLVVLVVLVLMAEEGLLGGKGERWEMRCANASRERRSFFALGDSEIGAEAGTGTSEDLRFGPEVVVMVFVVVLAISVNLGGSGLVEEDFVAEAAG